MYEWTECSLLKFHPDKCATMRIGKSNVPRKVYTMGPDKKPLKESHMENDIGVFIDDKLSFDEHISSKVNKANSTMGVIRRNFEYLDETTFLLLYKALVRPHIEYANQVWSPILKKQETVIENVQRRATRLLPGFKDLTYEERLKKLNLPTLKYRRYRGDMIEMFKILTCKYDEKVCGFIQLNTNQQHDTRGHKYKIEKRFSRLNIKKFAFVNRCVEMWNSLPAQVVESATVKAFEARLDRLWKDADFKFDCSASPPAQHYKYTELTLEACPGLQSEEDL
jgi:hypothetical protein